MKKILILAAALVVLAACGNNVKAPRTPQEYNDALEQMMSKAEAEFAELTDDAARLAFQEKFTQEYKDFNLNVLKANLDNSLSVEALKAVSFDLSPEEILGYIDQMPDSVSSNAFVKQAKILAEGRKGTSEGCKFVDFAVFQHPDEAAVSLSDYAGKGKYLLVDFWASWCGSCRGEIPNLKAVYEKYAGESFDMLSVAVWDEESKTLKAAEEEGICWNQIINAGKGVTEAYGIEGIPCILLIGPDGTILKRDLRGADVEAAVAEALGR